VDRRSATLAAIRGSALDPHAGSVTGLADRLVLDAFPENLTPADAVRRLLPLLKEDNPGTLRKLLDDGAALLGMRIVRADPHASPVGEVERILKEADRLTSSLRDMVEDMEGRQQVVAVRSTDPGASISDARCPECGVPKLISAALLRLDQAGSPWVVLASS